jgi:hypothetical protein
MLVIERHKLTLSELGNRVNWRRRSPGPPADGKEFPGPPLLDLDGLIQETPGYLASFL